MKLQNRSDWSAIALLRCFKFRETKNIFFTDEKNFYLNPPVTSQNNRIWASAKTVNVKPARLLIQRAEFAQHVMVCAGVCCGRKGRLHFIDEKAKVDAAHYVGHLFPNSSSSRTASSCCRPGLSFSRMVRQRILHALRRIGSRRTAWISSQRTSGLQIHQTYAIDYHVWGAMLEAYHKLHPKPKSVTRLKEALQVIWEAFHIN